MASIGPRSTPNTGVAPRPKRQPRKLDFLKCSSCRKAKVKCIPRHQTDGKCTRCWHKNVICSGLQRKAAIAVQTQSSKRLPVTSPDHSDATLDYDAHDDDAHDAHMLISFYHILDLAIQELIVIGKKQLVYRPYNDTAAWKVHLGLLDVVIEHYRNIMENLEEALKRIPYVSGYIITAFMYLKYSAHNTDRATSIRDAAQLAHSYLSDGHYGMAYIFQIRTAEYREAHEQKDIERLLQTKDDFSAALEPVLKRWNIPLTTYGGDPQLRRLNFSETQLFIPRNLLQLPTVAAAIEKDGRRDILGRFPTHILYDAMVNKDSGFDVRTDDSDVMGRSTLHIACSMTTQERQTRRLDLTCVTWPGGWMLGLRPLHIAAARGNLDIFYTFVTYELSLFADGNFLEPSNTGQTFLHLAARYGHLEVILFLTRSMRGNLNMLYYRDEMDKTALHYAARFGHAVVVRTILLHPESVQLDGFFPFSHRKVFFSAVMGGHLDIIKLVESHMDVDVDDEDTNEQGIVLSPLAEVARQGFLDCVDYFLSHEKVSVNAINGQMTPLDYAIASDHDQCVELMERYGARTYVEIMNHEYSSNGPGVD